MKCLPPVLDCCCGSRMFYADKKDPRVVFCDNRKFTKTLCDGRTLDINPDMQIDIMDLHEHFQPASFSMVIFDPPHLLWGTGFMADKYGLLPREWERFFHNAFGQIFRVLKPNGTLIFKWSDHDIKLKKLMPHIQYPGMMPLIKHSAGGTHFIVFIKE